MNLYPALKAHMGDWTYYIVKMKMRELGAEVHFASEVSDDRTLDDAIQRMLNESRAKTSIVNYLTRRDDRFFSSLVVAALGGAPKFYPVSISDEPEFRVFSDQGLDNAFGVLTFSGGQKYYALDGQHRLKAIKTLLDKSEEASVDAPEGFADEEISVILIIHREGEDPNAFRQKYRRLFSSLNRYAKATDKDTNIIMDEDDVFAILTRRLISEHKFFRAPGRQAESFRVLTKGKNLKSGQSYFTSLQTLYAMNQMFLSSADRVNRGWGSGAEREKEMKQFLQFRPEEEYLDALYDELVLYWDALLAVLPVLHSDPAEVRNHTADGDDEREKDLLPFWPIGQELLVKIARRLLNQRLRDSTSPTMAECKAVLGCLSQINWDMHAPPWRHFLLVGDGTEEASWKMRSEDRRQATSVGERILAWLVGLDSLNDDEQRELRQEWSRYLSPAQSKEDIARMWDLIRLQKLQ
jgi:DNA sulfur modification protein DndB